MVLVAGEQELSLLLPSISSSSFSAPSGLSTSQVSSSSSPILASRWSGCSTAPWHGGKACREQSGKPQHWACNGKRCWMVRVLWGLQHRQQRVDGLGGDEGGRTATTPDHPAGSRQPDPRGRWAGGAPLPDIGWERACPGGHLAQGGASSGVPSN